MHCADINFSVVHVNHNINKDSEKWAKFCKSICEKLNIPIIVQNTTVNNKKKIGIEAAARNKDTFFSKLRCDVIVLAHHLNVMLKTFLLGC